MSGIEHEFILTKRPPTNRNLVVSADASWQDWQVRVIEQPNGKVQLLIQDPEQGGVCFRCPDRQTAEAFAETLNAKLINAFTPHPRSLWAWLRSWREA